MMSTRSSVSLLLPIPTLARLALRADNLLDRTPPHSPSRGPPPLLALPRPLHPTPAAAVDWDARPLPAPPAYDAVAQDEDDMEVRGAGFPRSWNHWK